MSQTITFPAPPTGGYFSGEHMARRVRRVHQRAIAIAASKPVNDYAAVIPERDEYLVACVMAAATSTEAGNVPAPVAAPVKARKQPSSVPTAAFANLAMPTSGTCEWKTSGKLCGQPLQDGFRFCAKHVDTCEKRGYPQRALPKAVR